MTSSIYSQSSQDKILSAETGLKVYYSKHDLQVKIQQVYGVSPLEFKLRNGKILLEFSKSVIDAYVVDNYDFDTINQHFWSFLNGREDVQGSQQVLIRDSGNVQNPFYLNRVANGPCVNADFEEGTLNGWDMYTGSVNSNPAEMTGASQIFTPGAQHTIMTPGVDPVAGIPTTNPNGGNFSLRLGDGTGTGGLAASVRQTFMVDPSNAVFTYSYAVVLEDPSGHSYGEKPFFKVNLYDQNGAQIACGEYEVVANSGLDASWVNYGGGWYRNWQTVFAPLNAYIGQNVTIEFITGDCSQGGHYGYAYVDAECSPLEIIPPGTLICDGNPVMLSAPAGAASYLWNTGSTNQSISTATPGNYSVQVTPLQGAACSITINANVGGSTGAPIANFSGTPTTICTGQAINFTDASTATNGATVDYWDYNFMDGSTNASTPDPIHQFTTAGTYDVQFVAGVLVPGQGGCYDTTYQTITVSDGPIAAFTVSQECQGAATQFTDASTSATEAITSWQWDFTSNGSIDNTQQNPSTVMGAAGSYTATLSVSTASGCSSSITGAVVVDPIPQAAYTSTNICEGVAMNFTDQSTVASGSITGYQWDFGDLVGSSTLQNASYTYPTPGQYNAVLTVTTDQGCVDSETHTVTMYPNPVADFTYGNGCLGTPTHFADDSDIFTASSATYGWDFTSNGSVDYQGTSTDYIYTTSGSYDVTLLVTTADGCVDQTTHQVIISPNPIPSFTGQNVCEDNNVTFTNGSTISGGSIVTNFWDFANGSTSTQLSPTQLFSNEGIYYVTLTTTSDQGCVASVTEPISVYPTPMAQFITNDVCDGNAVNFTNFSSVSNQFTSNSVMNWTWDYGTTPSSGTTGQFASTTYPSPGTYTVTLTVMSNHGCSDIYQTDVVVYPNPVVSFESPNPSGCTEWCPTINNTSSIASGINNAYLWSLGDGTASTDQNPVHCYNNNTLQTAYYTVSLTVTSDFGCATTYTDNNFITVYPTPIAEFTNDPIEGDIYNPTIDFINQSQIADTYFWNFENLGTSEIESPTFTFPDQDSGTYTVCLHVETIYGCENDICHDVVINGFSNIYVPNAFTPDGDGLNDFFKPELYGFTEDDYNLMIFDRWGLLIYSTDSQSGSWNGQHKGQDCVEDAYVWKIKAVDKYNGEQKNFIGHVTLLR